MTETENEGRTDRECPSTPGQKVGQDVPEGFVPLSSLISTGLHWGFINDAIGCRFPGKKPGTWREVVGLSRGGKHVEWESEARRGLCWLSTFLEWIDKKQLVQLPAKDQANG